MIKLQNIDKRYGNKIVFNQLNVTIEEHEKVLITAPSGSGKTTLIRMLMGFELPDSGSIEIGRMPLNSNNVKKIREMIAYVSQDADLSHDTVHNQISKIFNYKINRHIQNPHDDFMLYCEQFGLDTSIINKNVQNLSGGERQRVAYIIAILLKRPIIILDEITAGLDVKMKEKIIQHTQTIESTFLIISHDLLWHELESIKVVTLA